MKKTLSVNLNGRVFNIDEDAYNLLENYLRNLKIYFRKDEGFAEIIADFEARIEELFSEHISSGHEVISIEEVEKVIQQVGKPEDFENIDSDDTANKTFEEKKEPETFRHSSGEKKTKKRLFRNTDNKLLGGVFSGIAAYFGWDETPVRIAGLILLAAIIPAYGWGIWLYLILWIIIPPAKTAQQKLEMRGEEVSIENIGKVVSGETTGHTKSDNEGCLGSILSFIASLAKIALVGIGILLTFIMTIILIVIFAVLLGVGGNLIHLPFEITNINMETGMTVALIASILVIGIPLLSLIYWIIAYFAKLNPMPKSIKVTGIILWIIALITLISSGINIGVNWNNETARKFHKKSWHFGWNDYRKNWIEGNRTVTDTTFVLPHFESINIDEDFIDADVFVEQSSDTGKFFIQGESNIINKIKWSVNNNKLKFSVDDNFRLDNNEPIIIKICSQDLKGVAIESIGSVQIQNKVNFSEFYVEIEGAGHCSADILLLNNFNGKVEGVVNIELKGKATKSNFKLEGAGQIHALDFESDDVYAHVQGIGQIQCNPIKSIEGKVDGIGSITYKNTPPIKNIKISGLGKVSQK